MLANRFCAEQLAEEGADRLPASQNQALVLRVEHQLTVVEMPG